MNTLVIVIGMWLGWGLWERKGEESIPVPFMAELGVRIALVFMNGMAWGKLFILCQ